MPISLNANSWLHIQLFKILLCLHSTAMHHFCFILIYLLSSLLNLSKDYNWIAKISKFCCFIIILNNFTCVYIAIISNHNRSFSLMNFSVYFSWNGTLKYSINISELVIRAKFISLYTRLSEIAHIKKINFFNNHSPFLSDDCSFFKSMMSGYYWLVEKTTGPHLLRRG